MQQCPPRGLGRVWPRMAAAQHVDSDVGAGCGGFKGPGVPWSPSRHGPINGRVVWVDAKDEKELEKYKGKLGGKIFFFGEMREVKPVEKALWERRDDANLKQTAEYPVHVGEPERQFQEFIKRLEFRE